MILIVDWGALSFLYKGKNQIKKPLRGKRVIDVCAKSGSHHQSVKSFRFNDADEDVCVQPSKDRLNDRTGWALHNDGALLAWRD